MIDDPLNCTKVKRGEQLPHAKLTNDDVRNIRALIDHREELKRQASLLSNKRLAEKYDVHQRTIEKLSSGFSWSHVT